MPINLILRQGLAKRVYPIPFNISWVTQRLEDGISCQFVHTHPWQLMLDVGSKLRCSCKPDHLHMVTPCRLAFPTKWWFCSKGNHPKNEGESQEETLYPFLKPWKSSSMIFATLYVLKQSQTPNLVKGAGI